MNFKEFMKELLDNNTSGVYLFESREDYLKETIIRATKDIVNIKEFNLIDIKQKSNYESIKTAFETYPVMEDKKYIMWRNIDLSKNSIKEYKEILENLEEDLEKFPSYASFFIFSDESPFKGKFYKKIQKFGKIVEIERLNNQELISFVGKRFLRNGKRIQKSLVSDIINRFSYLSKDSKIDLYHVVNTVDKIISNSKNEIVLEKDVYDQLDQVLNLNIFNLTDAISERNNKKASTILLEIENKEDDLFMVYHMIIRHIRNLIGVKKLMTDSYNESFIMKNLGIGSYELKKLKNFAYNFKEEELFEIHDFLYKMEKNQKSQDFDMSLYLLMLIQKICIK